MRSGPFIDLLKRLRAMPGPNLVVATTTRAALRLAGRQSEYAIRHLPRSGTVRCQLPDGRRLTMKTRGDDWIPNQLFWRGFRGYEAETTPLFYRLASDARVTLDVGAYVGFFALLAAIANPRGRVYAFEPLSTLATRLRANCVANALHNVTCIEAAVSDTDGSAGFFHQTGNDTPSSSSLSYEFMKPLDEIDELTRSTVPLLTLDTFCGQRSVRHVDLVKIDVETTEAAVIRGMRGVLTRDRPHVVCELLPSSRGGPAIEEVLAPLGYHYYILSGEGPLQRQHIAPDPEWSNQLFTRFAPADLSDLGDQPPFTG